MDASGFSDVVSAVEIMLPRLWVGDGSLNLSLSRYGGGLRGWATLDLWYSGGSWQMEWWPEWLELGDGTILNSFGGYGFVSNVGSKVRVSISVVLLATGRQRSIGKWSPFLFCYLPASSSFLFLASLIVGLCCFNRAYSNACAMVLWLWWRLDRSWWPGDDRRVELVRGGAGVATVCGWTKREKGRGQREQLLLGCGLGIGLIWWKDDDGERVREEICCWWISEEW